MDAEKIKDRAALILANACHLVNVQDAVKYALEIEKQVDTVILEIQHQAGLKGWQKGKPLDNHIGAEVGPLAIDRNKNG